MSYFVIDGSGYKAAICLDKKVLTLSNGLVTRVIDVDKCATVSYKNLISGVELITKPHCDIEIILDKNKRFADEFTFVEAKSVDRIKRLKHTHTATMTEKREFPPAGKAFELIYISKPLNIKATVHYEIYDEIPTIMKQVFIENLGATAVKVENIKVDIMNIENNFDNLFVDSNYNAGMNISYDGFKSYAKHFANYEFGMLEVRVNYRMNVKLEPSSRMESIIAYELFLTSEYYEQRQIEIKTMYRYLAPWSLDTTLFFHLIANTTGAIKKAVDQCEELGMEMIIQSFGSGVNMESHNPRYLERIRKAYEYSHSKGVRIGAYTLAYVKNYRPVKGDEALNHDYSHICRCLSNDWADKYTKSVLNFIDTTKADAIEIDGPYGMLLCSGGKTHHHDDFTDSQYKQWKHSVDDWYTELKARDIYINAPDWHFHNGINRCPVGYEEISFSEKRAEQLVVSRIYYYKGTFIKNPSQCWGFLPLNVYHGGGTAAQFFPTDKNSFEFDWAMAQIVASGVWPTLRGRKIYDCETGRDILKKWIAIYKQYRQVLNGITVHFMPPIIDKSNPERTTGIDAIMNQLPQGDTRGFVMFFNQTDKGIKQSTLVPMYYTGLTDKELPPAPFPNTKNCDIDYPVYGDEVAPLVIVARDSKARTYTHDEIMIDKEIPNLEVATPTAKAAIVSKNDTEPKEYIIDSNGNITLELDIPAMSYQWFTIRKA